MRNSLVFILLILFPWIISCTSITVGDEYNLDTGCPPSSILFFNPEKIYKPEIIRMKSKGIDEEYEHLVLCHFSDIHGSKVNLGRVIEFCNYYRVYIDDIIHTGDSVADQFSDDFSFWSDTGASCVLNTIGNHDSAYRGDKWVWRENVGKNCYDKFISPFVSQWEVNQPDCATESGLCYYYKDYDDSRIRLIVLDCMSFDSSQYSWLVNVLSDAQTNNYGVICISHYAAGVLDHSFENVFDSKSPVEHTTSFLNEKASNAVDAFIDSGGEFICWLGGHIHIDSCARLASYHRQLCINIAEAKCSGDFGDQDRVFGTKSQDLFNIIAINRNARELSLLRVGADRDRLGRYRFKASFKY